MDELKNIKQLLGIIDSAVGSLNETTNSAVWVWIIIVLCVPAAWGILWLLVEKGVF
jgi:hypothetical protein